MTDQNSINIVATVSRARLGELVALLAEMGRDPGGNHILPLKTIETIHFARILVLPESLDHRANAIAPTLVLATNFDGRPSDHLRQLVRQLPSGLDQVFSHCNDYPDLNRRSEQSRLAFLKKHLHRTNTLYVNTRGRTVQRVQREKRLREVIESFITSRDWTGTTPLDAVDEIRKHARDHPEISWALEPPESQFSFRFWRTLKLAIVGLIALIAVIGLFFLPVLSFAFSAISEALPWVRTVGAVSWSVLILFLVALRLHEVNNLPDNYRPPNARLKANESVEDLGSHNQLSAYGFLQKGLFRKVLTWLVMWAMNFSTENLFYRGQLASVDTIHFARWVMLGRGRVIFFSNYDGSLESYNDDFVDRVPLGLNLIFSNGQGWPRSRFLAFKGARDEQAFKLYLRDHQVPTQVWYEAPAYDGLSAVNLRRNSQIREGLGRPLNETEAARWLQLL